MTEHKVRSVLLVEADPDVQAHVARALRGHGYCVVGTSSGDGAQALTSQWEVDLILVSQDLPGRVGIEVTRSLHAQSANLPIVVVAAPNEPGVEEAARRAGAIGYLEKPLTMAKLEPFLTPGPRLRRVVPDDHVAVAQ